MSSIPATKTGNALPESVASSETGTVPDASGVRDLELNVSLACPQCGHSGWTQWKKLRRGMRCPKCQCQFLLDRNGQLMTEEELPQVRFSCPRCGQAGSIPKLFNVRKAACGVCKLQLVMGPDHQLHGAEEVAKMRRAHNAAALEQKQKDLSIARGLPQAAPPAKRRRTMLAGAAAAAVVVLAAWWMMGGASPDGRVDQFTATCLTGRWNDCYAYILDDDVAQAEFDRWRIRYFPSIVDKVRPKGDAVEIDVELLTETADQRVFRVTLRSPFIGTRQHVQHWIASEGGWWFDPAETLRASDPVRRSHLLPQ